MTRRIESVLLGSLAVGVVAAGIAWACTPSADIVVSPPSGKSGDSAAVLLGDKAVSREPGRPRG